ncbi:MAG: hypothetical protein M3P51_07760 [Chloroflexota bacterium]|nr:hypothetical protein [Chloroflexota bacterium]
MKHKADAQRVEIGDLSPDGRHTWGSGGAWESLWLLPDEVVSAVRAHRAYRHHAAVVGGRTSEPVVAHRLA